MLPSRPRGSSDVASRSRRLRPERSTRAAVEDLHRRRQVDPHQEDRVAKVRLWVLTEPLGRLATTTARAGQPSGPGRRSGRCRAGTSVGSASSSAHLIAAADWSGAQDHVAAGDVGRDPSSSPSRSSRQRPPSETLFPTGDVVARRRTRYRVKRGLSVSRSRGWPRPVSSTTRSGVRRCRRQLGVRRHARLCPSRSA